MYPTIFTIPWLNWPIRAYGLMLMIGFLGGAWWAARRAARVKCDPDLVINLSFTILIASLIGARVFYVIHYWDTHFAGRGLWAPFDITAGGMEFYGGFIGAIVAVLGYLLIRRAPMRIYFDILAPSLMFGMGMTRIGCFLNGCCWGAACGPEIPWSVRFPYASPAAYGQWEERVITYPAELIYFYQSGPSLINRDTIDEALRKSGPMRAYVKAQNALDEAQTRGADPAALTDLRKQRDAARRAWQTSADANWLAWHETNAGTTLPQMLRMAGSDEGHTHTVHPAQLYSSIDGFVTALLLSAIFYRRKQHGLVFGMVFLLYPIMRFCEEIIRSDNPHDVIGLTISQFISVSIFLIGVVYLIVIYRMPAHAPVPVGAPSPPSRHPQRSRTR